MAYKIYMEIDDMHFKSDKRYENNYGHLEVKVVESVVDCYDPTTWVRLVELSRVESI